MRTISLRSRQPSNSRVKRGVTLVELLVVISTMALITTLAMMTIFYLLRVEGQSAGALSEDLIFSQLAVSFRNDVHAAEQTQILDDGTLELVVGTSKIHYSPVKKSIVRQVHANNEVESHNEFFLGQMNARFQIDAPDDSATQTVRMTLSQVVGTQVKNDSTSKRTHEQSVIAVIGKDRRFISQGATP
ncbi:MAG: hypothetical protein CMJ78_22075 [Planctomycetaceae bacterium]|nr:hypothetical protein [Planctomycetaceae bacterium]